jgi:hypothetical protein
MKKPRLDPITKSVLASANCVTDLCSDSDDRDGEKPKAKEDSSSIEAMVDTRTISPLPRTKRTPVATATAEATTKTASPNIAMTFSPPTDFADNVDDAKHPSKIHLRSQ